MYELKVYPSQLNKNYEYNNKYYKDSNIINIVNSIFKLYYLIGCINIVYIILYIIHILLYYLICYIIQNIQDNYKKYLYGIIRIIYYPTIQTVLNKYLKWVYEICHQF